MLPDPKNKKNHCSVCCGIRKAVKNSKSKIGPENIRGKEANVKNNCIQTCKNIRKKQQKSYFAHLLLVLDCNLMRRYEN